MNPQAIANLSQAILQAAQLSQALMALVGEIRGDLNEADEQKLQLSLQMLQSANDEAYKAVQAKLAKAAGE